MENLEKSINLKASCFQWLPALLVGAAAMVPEVSFAEPSDRATNVTNLPSVVERDPFSPPGYIFEKTQSGLEGKDQKRLAGTSNGKDWDGAMKQIIINGVSSRSGNEYVAVINNQVKVVGESVSISFKGTHYTWKIDSVEPPSSVKLRRVSAQ